MTIHIASINGIHLLPSAELRARARTGIVSQMASHLVAGTTGGLDLENERDVIKYLMDTPERYRWPAIHMHLDAALYEAQETLIAMEMSR